VTTNSPSQTNDVVPISSAIVPNCRIANFGSACQLDGNSACFELKRASDADKAIVANVINEANVAKEADEANKADEAKANEADKAIVANEAAETDEAYLAVMADMAEAIDKA
jgi:hypothetical protein